MRKNTLITGTSRGLGKAFAMQLLQTGYSVYGCARGKSAIEHDQYQHGEIDLAQLSQIEESLQTLLDGVKELDLIILNAGILGDIKAIADFDMDEISHIMDVNVWSNKVILDTVFKSKVPVGQVVLISSGAAVNGSKGWGAYALSKATLNMLSQLYAAEFTDTHFISLAPGLIDTDMQRYLCNPEGVDEQQFSTMGRLRSAQGTAEMPNAQQAAELILEKLPSIIEKTQSGSFVDIRSFV